MDEFWFWVSPYLWQTGPRIFRWCRAGPLGIDRVDDLPIGRAAAGLPASTQPGGWTLAKPLTTAEPTARSRLSTPTVGLADIPARWTPAGSGVRCVLAGLDQLPDLIVDMRDPASALKLNSLRSAGMLP